jgi:hypothetical protein
MRPAWLTTVVLAAGAAGAGGSPAPAPPPANGSVEDLLGPALGGARVPMPPGPSPGATLDAMMEARWREAGVVPAPPASDAAWLRRVTLDLVGRVPTLSEVESFAANHHASKREQAVDDLLASVDYAEHWADVAMDLYIERGFRKPGLEKQLDPRSYFVAAYRANVPYWRMVTDMLTYSGDLGARGTGVFLASHLRRGGPEALAAASARVFLGLQLSCAQCHDHPYDARYKQDDFYGLVAYFATTRFKQDKQDGSAFIVAKPRGVASFKRPGASDETVVPPRFLGRAVTPRSDHESPREIVAQTIVRSDLFAKAVVARTWESLFGQGLVDAWDDLGGENDSRHPELLRWLARDFARSSDFKQLLRLLLLSRAYGLDSSTGGAPAAPRAPPAFARGAVRRLTPEQLLRSLRVATGADNIDPATADQADKRLRRLRREFEYTFGDDEMASVDAFAGSIPQSLLLWNGEVTNQGARARRGSTLANILASTPDPKQRLRRMFLATYSRSPTDEEMTRFLPALASPADYEDLYFALLTSTEMLTNH